MPFELCNAPATFQRLMDSVLAGLHWRDCLVYIDDIVVVGKSFEEHLHNLQQVLERLRQAGLKLQPASVDFCNNKSPSLATQCQHRAFPQTQKKQTGSGHGQNPNQPRKFNNSWVWQITTADLSRILPPWQSRCTG